ncbi:MAG: 30S ribosomal protein S12 methylthiotransferase RimO [Oscillospiraceae bacterium]|nr:30S ribosomal protein S12 methylthiotransferase RimO [Oscillospiraceae bacterium]
MRMIQGMNETKTVALISLGCPKNLVNSEEMMALLSDAGYVFTDRVQSADAVIINTCAFIESAKSEAIEKILETAAVREENPDVKIIVTGCLAQRYPREIREELPEVDGILGTGSYSEIVTVLDGVLRGERPTCRGNISAPLRELPRIVSTGPAWAYLRIAEGCDNRCAYCVIPSLRGRFRSRKKEDVLAEARELVAAGCKELILVAQDITRYGMDLYGKPCLAELVKELCKLDVSWIRLHYLYPELVSDELIDVIAAEPKVVKYLDIPIQHINDGILKRMNRRSTGGEIRVLFQKLRERIPGLVLRTSIITGLPGEGEAEFEELCTFLRQARLERAGFFPYSPEEGTPAAEMPDRCTREEAERRAQLCMELQGEIMDEFDKSLVGRTLPVLCMGRTEDGSPWGRSPYDSPDIDSRVVFSGSAAPGELTEVLITAADEGELIGEQVGE